MWSPASPEPYYIPTGNELKPQPVGEEAGTVIFQYYPMSAVNYVSLLIPTGYNEPHFNIIHHFNQCLNSPYPIVT